VRSEEEEVEQQNGKSSQASRAKWGEKKGGAVCVTDFDRSVTTL